MRAGDGVIETHKHALRDGEKHAAVCGVRSDIRTSLFDDKVTCANCRKVIRKTMDAYRNGISPSPNLASLEAAWAILDAAA